MGQNRTEDRTRRSRGIPVVSQMGSKVRAERYIENSGLGQTILRLPAVLGKEDSFLSSTIVSALREGTFFTCDTGRHKVSLMCVSNLGVEIPRRKRSLFSLLTHLGDKRFLLRLIFSRFGAHFLDNLPHSHIPHTHGHSWQEGVAEAVAGYLTGG